MIKINNKKQKYDKPELRTYGDINKITLGKAEPSNFDSMWESA